MYPLTLKLIINETAGLCEMISELQSVFWTSYGGTYHANCFGSCSELVNKSLF